MRRLFQDCLALLICILYFLFICQSNCLAQNSNMTNQGTVSASSPVKPTIIIKEPVKLDRETIFYVAGNNPIQTKKRAKNISTAILNALMNSDCPVRTKINYNNQTYHLLLGNEKITTVTKLDSIANNLSERNLSRRWKAAIDKVARKCDNESLSESLNPPMVDAGISLLLMAFIIVLSEFIKLKLNKYIAYISRERLESISTFYCELKERNNESITEEQLEANKLNLKEKLNKIATELNNLLNLIVKVIQVAAVLIFINYVLYRFPVTNIYFRDLINFELSIIDIIREETFDWISSPASWEAFGRIILIIIATMLLFRVINIIGSGTENILNTIINGKHIREARIQTLSRVVKTTLKIILLLFSIVIILGQMGLNVAPILAGAGIVGLAISFGAQSLVKDLINGIFILLEDQFGMGDVIKINNISGTVENMTLRITVIRDTTGTAHIIPNGQITTVSVYTKEWARAEIAVVVDSREDIDKTIQIMKDVAESLRKDYSGKIISEPKVLGVTDMSDVTSTIKINMETTPGDQWFIQNEYRRRIRYALKQEEPDDSEPKQ